MSEEFIHELREHGAIARVLVWNGKVSERNRVEVVMTRDGCLQVTIEKKYLYPQEAELLARSMLELIAGREQEQREAKALNRVVAGDLLEHHGEPVDLSINQTQLLLRRAVRGRLTYQGHVWNICQTTLMDRISTGDFSDGSLPHVQYGARLITFEREGRTHRLFAVVSGTTDG